MLKLKYFYYFSKNQQKLKKELEKANEEVNTWKRELKYSLAENANIVKRYRGYFKHLLKSKKVKLIKLRNTQ